VRLFPFVDYNLQFVPANAATKHSIVSKSIVNLMLYNR